MHAFFKEDPSLNSNLLLQVNDIHISLFILSMIFDNMNNDFIRVITYWIGVTIFIITLAHSHFLLYTFSNLHYITGKSANNNSNN